VQSYVADNGGDVNTIAGTLGDCVPQTWDGFALLKQALDATKGDTSGTKLADAILKLQPFTGAAGKDAPGSTSRDAQRLPRDVRHFPPAERVLVDTSRPA